MQPRTVLAVAVITLGVLLLLRAATDQDSPGKRATFTTVAEVAVALTLVVVLVAVRRLNLYENAFGLTMLRLYSELFSYWIGAVFLFLGAALAGVGRGRGWFVEPDSVPPSHLTGWAAWNLGHERAERAVTRICG